MVGSSEGTKNQVGAFKCDNAPELGAAAKQMVWATLFSIPHVHATNLLAENRVKFVTYGARSALQQAGLSARWWPYALRYFCTACNVSKRPNRQSAWAERHGKGKFTGMIIPFGALVDFLPPTPIRKKLGKFELRLWPGIFLGYAMHVGGAWDG